MASDYKQISSEFIRAYHAIPDQFEQLVKMAFDQAINIDEKNAIFFAILAAKDIQWTVDKIQYMMDTSAIPMCQDNSISANKICCTIYRCLKTPDPNTLRVLIDNGLTVDDENIHHFVCLVDLIRVLLEKGIDVKLILAGLADDRTRNPLVFKPIYQIVIDNLNEEIVSGLDKDVLRKLFQKAIRQSIISMDVINIFISNGLDISNDVDHIFAQLCLSNISTVKSMWAEYTIDINANNGRALYNALSFGRMEIVKFLLDLGAIVLDEHVSVALNIVEAIEILINYGFVGLDYAGQGLFHNIFNGVGYGGEPHLCFAKKIIGDGIDINKFILECTTNTRKSGSIDDDVDDVIDIGEMHDNEDLSALMATIEGGADINANNGEALYNALQAKCFDTVKMLLESDAKVLDRHISIALHNKDIFDILANYINVEQAAKILAHNLFNARRIGPNEDYLDIAKKLIREGVDFNQIITNTIYNRQIEL